MKLDTKAVHLKLPLGKADVIFFDDDLAGFGIRLRVAGGILRRTWVAQYRAHGRTRRMKIGAVEKISAEEARKAARKNSRQGRARRRSARRKGNHTTEGGPHIEIGRGRLPER